MLTSDRKVERVAVSPLEKLFQLPNMNFAQIVLISHFQDFPGETLDLGGLSISDPQGHDDEWPRKTDEGTKQVEQNFKFSKSDRDKEMAFLLKKFYQGKLFNLYVGRVS